MTYHNITKLAFRYNPQLAPHRRNIFDSGEYDEEKTHARIQADIEQKQQYVANLFNRVKSGLGFGSK